eukprot:14817885-Alexandrium_andersonii.AAC.1
MPTPGNPMVIAGWTLGWDGVVLRQEPELRQNVLAAGDRHVGVVGRGAGRAELGGAGLLDAIMHGMDNHRDAFVLGEVAALPEAEARLADGLGLEAELGLDDGTDNGFTVRDAVPENAPHVGADAARAVEELEAHGREADVRDLAILDTVHGLADAGGPEDGAQHGSAVGDVAAEERA